jgi:hypothetical protein
VVLRYLPHRAVDHSAVDPTDAIDELGVDGVGIALAHE